MQTLSEQDRAALVEATRSFAALRLAPNASRWDAGKIFPVDTLREAGAVVMPFSPCFYLRPAGVDELLEQFCGRIFDQVGLAHTIARWTGQA